MLYLLLCVFILASAAQDQTNIFLTPQTNGINNDFSENPTYVLGSTITLEWTTTFPSTELVLWQNGNSSSQVLQSNIVDTSLAWTVGTGENPSFDLTKGIVFFFQMYNSSTQNFFSSHYFNISDPALASTTSALPTSTTAPSTTSAPPATSLSSTSATATTAAAVTPSKSPSPSPTPHHDNKIGEGLGIGIGICVVLFLAVALAWTRLRRSALRKTNIAASYESTQPWAAAGHPSTTDYRSPVSSYGRYELSSTTASGKVELEGGKNIR